MIGTRKSTVCANGWSVQFWCCCLVSRRTCQGNCAEDGRHGHWVCWSFDGVRKSAVNFMVRSTSSFVDKLRAEKTTLRQLADKIATFRYLAQPSWSQSIVQSMKVLEESKELIRAYKLPRERFHGHSCQNRGGHCAWTHPQSHRGGTPWEIRPGTCYKSPLLPFTEACMIEVPTDPPGLRKKLDVQWMKGIWVGRLDESDGHVVLTSHGTVTARSVRSSRSGGKDHKSCSRPGFL